MHVRITRAIGAAVLIAAATTALTSCSSTGSAPGGAESSASVPVQAPPSDSATPVPSVASDTPAPAVTPVATPVASAAPTASGDARAKVVPFITTADWDAGARALDVSAIVPGVVESGGTCTITVTSGATVRTATSDGVGASSYTGCEAVAVKGLAAGTWQVRVAYASEKSAGTSAVKTAQVG
jgi:hypothetical protein